MQDPRLTRRDVLRAAAAAGATVAVPFAHAQASAWPTKPVQMIVPFPAGGGTDAFARPLAAQFAKQTGRQLIIDNRGGAGGTVGASIASRAAPDGYNLFMGAVHHTIAPSIYPKLDYDLQKDLIPITLVARVPQVIVVNPQRIPAKDFKEFLALVKANPGKYNYASTGNGTGTHMAFAELNAKLGLNMVHVPYKGGPEAMQAVLKGETCCIMNQVQTVLTQYKAGKVRLVGVTTARRVAAVQEVPTIAESGIAGTQGFDSSTWFGLFAPKGTDPAVVGRLNAAVRQVLQMPDVRARLEGAGNTVRLETPEQFRQTVHANRLKWAEVVRASSITLD